MTFPPPRRVDDKIHRMTIKGYCCPFKNDQPLLAMMHGTSDMFLLLFSEVEKLYDVMTRLDFAFDTIKKIDSQKEFIESLPAHIRIAVDPYFTDTGSVRFMEIQRRGLLH